MGVKNEVRCMNVHLHYLVVAEMGQSGGLEKSRIYCGVHVYTHEKLKNENRDNGLHKTLFACFTLTDLVLKIRDIAEITSSTQYPSSTSAWCSGSTARHLCYGFFVREK